MFKKSNVLIGMLILTTSVITTASKAGTSGDPFIQEWDYFDGVKTFVLNIKKSPAPGQDYHIDYTSVGGYSATDMCKLTSSTSFHCVTGETVTRDPSTYSVKVDATSGSYVYYDPSHMPPVSGVLGNWAMHFQKSGYEADYSISVMTGPRSDEFNVVSAFTDNNSGHCYQNPVWANVFRATPNPDGTETLTDIEQGDNQFKYDPKTNQIINPNPGSDFNVGMCIGLSGDIPILFTKQKIANLKITYPKLAH